MVRGNLLVLQVEGRASTHLVTRLGSVWTSSPLVRTPTFIVRALGVIPGEVGGVTKILQAKWDSQKVNK